MQAENYVGLRIFQNPLLDHQRSAAFLSRWRAFLGGLENEFDLAAQLRFQSRQQFRDPHQHGNMAIVPAGMHDADFLAVEGRALL